MYHTIAIDNTIFPVLSDISSEQYKASVMQLSMHSDASYLTVSQPISRASGVHFLSDEPPNPNNTEYFLPTVNGIILVVCKIMHNIMALSAKAEYGTIFVNIQTDVHICTTLTEMG